VTVETRFGFYFRGTPTASKRSSLSNSCHSIQIPQWERSVVMTFTFFLGVRRRGGLRPWS
jgi:hypothetical protein